MGGETKKEQGQGMRNGGGSISQLQKDSKQFRQREAAVTEKAEQMDREVL